MNGQRSYNLLCQPWIPVIWRAEAPQRHPSKVGIREALERAHEIRCISHTVPFIEFGLCRLLITIVLDAYIVAGRRPTIGKIQDVLIRGQFDDCVVSTYTKRYADRFDLWNDQHPFLQLPSTTGKAEDIAKMIAPVPSGTKITLWHHLAQTETSLTDEQAAQELCAVAPFCFDYAPKDVCTIAGDPPMYVVVQGESLFETIVLNLPRPNGRVELRREREEGPSWRCPIVNAAEIPRSPTYAQGWTWPVRQVRLLRDDPSSGVSKAVNVAGAGKTATKERVHGWRDPNAGTVTNSGEIRHIRATDLVPKPARSAGQGDRNPLDFWRDLVPMCLVASEGEVLRRQQVRSRPEVVTNALRIADGALLRLAVYGFVDKGGKNNKVFRTWFRSVLMLPAEVARDSRLSARALGAFATAQRVADALRTALRMLRPVMDAVPRERKKLNEQRRGEADAISAFWRALEPILAHSYLDSLTRQDADAERELHTRLRGEARDAFRRAAAPLRRDADGLLRIANAGNYLERRLATLLKRETNT